MLLLPTKSPATLLVDGENINCGLYLAVFLLASFARFSFALLFIIALTRSALEVNVGSEYYNGK